MEKEDSNNVNDASKSKNSFDKNKEECPFENPYLNNKKDIQSDKEIKNKYRINYSKIISKLRIDSDFVDKKASVEFQSATLLLYKNIDITSKISLLTLISYLNHSKKNKEYIYYLNNKIYKYLDKNKGTEPYIYIRTLWRAACLLNEENNNFYAYYYLNKALKMVKTAKIPEDSKNLLNSQWEKVNSEIQYYLENTYDKFLNTNLRSEKELNKLKSVIDKILDTKNIIKDDICYLISSRWILCTKVFVECLINAKKSNIELFLKDVFEFDKVLKEYLEDPYDRKANGQFFPGPIDNYCITCYKDSLIDPLKEEENNYLKKNLKHIFDYYYVNEEDWKYLSDIFGYTNVFKINKNDINNLKTVELFLFDKRFRYNQCEFMIKKRCAQLPGNQSIKELEEKIIRVVDYELKNELKRIEAIPEIRDKSRTIRRRKKKNTKEVKKIINILDDDNDDNDNNNKNDKNNEIMDIDLSNLSNEKFIELLNNDNLIENLQAFKSKVNQRKIIKINKEEKIKSSKNKNIINNANNINNEEEDSEYEVVDLQKEIEEELRPLNEEKKKVLFYWIPKSKINILIQMNYGFLNGMTNFEYEFLYELTPKNYINIYDLSVNSLIKFLNKDKILLAEIVPANKVNDFKFFYPIYNTNKCSICDKSFDEKKKIFNCEICDYSKFCSQLCALESDNHLLLHEFYKDLLVEVFDLNEFFKKDLYSFIPKNCGCREGIAGLNNIGNSCYMNSTLQCLSNTIDLTKYFIFDLPSSEINMGNRLGSNGEICKVFSNLIRNLWMGTAPVIDPSFIKSAVYKVSGLFGDYEQQDSQEFLSVFLDHLHEDLNHITTKPYIELNEQQSNEDDYTASKRFWDAHIKREDSIIVDLFHGQFRNTITCLNCGNQSVTYDPFMFLGLPLPSSHNQIAFKYFEDDKYKQINLSLDEKSDIRKLKEKVLEFTALKEIKIEFDDLEETDKASILSTIEAVQLDKDKKIVEKNTANDIKISGLLKKNIEICIYKKLGRPTSFNLYVYPVIDDDNKGVIYLSYPVAIPVLLKTTLEELKELIIARLYDFFNDYKDNIKHDSLINLLILHNQQKAGGIMSFFSTKPTCEFCKKACDPDTFCLLSERFNKKASVQDLMNKLSNDRPLIILAKSNYYNTGGSKFIYKDMVLGLNHYKTNNSILNKKDNFNLFDSLYLFGQKEMLDKENMWYCKRCKEHREASKTIQIYKPPNYLIIQFKRFKPKSNSTLMSFWQSGKIETNIEYPIADLDLRNYIMGPEKDNAVYNLYAVIEHVGYLGGGHYTAICKNKDMWVRYNDAECSREDSPLTKNAYLLFYRRKGLENDFK